MAALVSTGAIAQSALQAADGFWAYTELQGGGKGPFMPLTGVILFKDGVIVQQSIFDDEPFAQAGAMAHAGSYASGPMGVHMITEQTISIAPGKDKPLSFRRDMPHDISAERAGEDLTIVFESGTVQRFKRIGPAAGEIYPLDKGVLALVDGHFLLVEGDAQNAVTGYGKYRKTGNAYALDVIRWSEATGSTAVNRRDVTMNATFDGTTFTLADGRAFRVASSAQSKPAASADGERVTLEEVVVSSRRREESLQDVPIAVSAFSSESIERNMLQGVDDVFSRTPNVSFTTEGSRDRKRLSIRGVTEFITEAGEATVPANTFGIYMDEFSVSTATSNPGVMDIERIEVLRGPQGTYFGRNAVGGALNIVTKKPTNEFFAEVSADVSRYDTFDLSGTLNVPLIDDKLAVRANVKYAESDGYIKNINPTGGGNDSEYKYGRLSLRYTPNDRMTLDVIASASDEVVGMREGVPSGVLSDFTSGLYGTVDPDGIGFWPENRDRVNFNRPQEVGSKYEYITGRLEYRFDTVRLTSVSGYLESDTFLYGDVDGGSQDLFYEHKPYIRDAVSQEFRLQSIEGETWDWTIGAIYSRDRGSIDQSTYVGNDQPFGLPVGFEVTRNVADNETSGAALFGEAVWHTTDRLDLLLGVRATQDKVKVTETTFTAGDARLFITEEETFDDVSPKFTASYSLNDDAKVYATISKGFKSGGVQIAANDLLDESYDPETIWNYEVGFKSDLLDGRARFNAAAFLMEWEDLQASFAVAEIDDEGTIVFTSGIQNAAVATNYGIEAEMSLLVTERLLLNFGAGYLHGKFDEFTNAFIDGEIVDLSDQPMPNAPRWTASADAQYSYPVSTGWEGFARLEWFYRDETYSDLTALARREDGFPFLVPSFSHVNLRAGFESPRYTIVAYVENLLDEEYFTNVYEKAFVSGMALQPSFQTYGVRFTMRMQ